MNLQQQIKNEPGFTIAALLRLYSYQSTSQHAINMGFNKQDSPLLCVFAKRYIQTGKLDTKELKAAARLLPKYASQLEGLEPVSIDVEKPKVDIAASRKASLSNKTIVIKFPNSFDDTRRIKCLSGRRYIKKIDSWQCPLNLRSVVLLKQWGFVFDAKLNNWLEDNRITLKDLISRVVDIPEGDFKLISRKQRQQLEKDGMEPIKFTGKQKCYNCRYYFGNKCSVCEEVVPIDIQHTGCLNWDLATNKYF